MSSSSATSDCCSDMSQFLHEEIFAILTVDAAALRKI